MPSDQECYDITRPAEQEAVQLKGYTAASCSLHVWECLSQAFPPLHVYSLQLRVSDPPPVDPHAKREYEFCRRMANLGNWSLVFVGHSNQGAVGVKLSSEGGSEALIAQMRCGMQCGDQCRRLWSIPPLNQSST